MVSEVGEEGPDVAAGIEAGVGVAAFSFPQHVGGELGSGSGVGRVGGDDVRAAGGRLRGETSGAAGTVQQPAGEIRTGQAEHRLVLRKGPGGHQNRTESAHLLLLPKEVGAAS